MLLSSSLFTLHSTHSDIVQRSNSLFRNKDHILRIRFCIFCFCFLSFLWLNGSSNSHSLHLRHSSTPISELRIPKPDIPTLPSWPATPNTHSRAARASHAGTRVPPDHRGPQGAKGLPELPHTAEAGWFRRRRRGALVRLL